MKEYARGGPFRIYVELGRAMIAGEQLYAELTAPGGSPVLRGTGWANSPSHTYQIDGMVPQDAPLGVYPVTKLELRQTLGAGSTTKLSVPAGSGIKVVEPNTQPPPAPKVLSIE